MPYGIPTEKLALFTLFIEMQSAELAGKPTDSDLVHYTI